MRAFLIGFAYFLIYTTPIGAGFLIWVFWIIFSTDHSILSLSTDILLQENLSEELSNIFYKVDTKTDNRLLI